MYPERQTTTNQKQLPDPVPWHSPPEQRKPSERTEDISSKRLASFQVPGKALPANHLSTLKIKFWRPTQSVIFIVIVIVILIVLVNVTVNVIVIVILIVIVIVIVTKREAQH